MMTNITLENFFRELVSKLIAAGLPEGQAQFFAEECVGYRDLNCAYFELCENQQLPSDECFRTLAEAQKVFESQPYRSEYSKELDSIDRYLKVPYSDVVSAKKAMSEIFGLSEFDIEEVYAQDPEWLLIPAYSVKEFAAFLRTKFSDPELLWSIYKGAALLGLERTQCRLNKVLDLLGAEIGEKVIRNDLQNGPWLYYRWFSDPVGCIEYMLECGLTPDQVRIVLEQKPLLLYLFKERRRRSYNHDQEYIDRTIREYTN